MQSQTDSDLSLYGPTKKPLITDYCGISIDRRSSLHPHSLRAYHSHQHQQPPNTPEKMADEGNTGALQVAGLAPSVTDSLLINMFRTYGPILRVKVDGFGGA